MGITTIHRLVFLDMRKNLVHAYSLSLFHIFKVPTAEGAPGWGWTVYTAEKG